MAKSTQVLIMLLLIAARLLKSVVVSLLKICSKLLNKPTDEVEEEKPLENEAEKSPQVNT